jgi:hypothetical protein
MNTQNLFVAAAISTLSLLSMGSAFAGEASYDYPVAFTSSVSRSDVQANTLNARAAGLIATGEQSVVLATAGMGLTRAQVKAETLEAIRLGAISRHEYSDAPTAAQLDSIRMAGLRALAMTTASL